MSKSISDSNASMPRRAATGASGLATALRAQRFRVDEVLREIGRRGRLASYGTPIAWGLGGFLIGAVFWHLIGVWGFLGAVVLKEPDAKVSVVIRQQPVAEARQEAVQPAFLPNCTVLVLDRSTGVTTSVPCPERMPLLEEARYGRQDLALAELQ
jgi:hypothetical protein